MTATAKEARKARALLRMNGFNSKEIPPRLFALAAKKLGKSLAELLHILAIAKTGGQGEGQSPTASMLAGNQD